MPPSWPCTSRGSTWLGVDFDAVARPPRILEADLANLINEAAIVAIRDDREVIFARDIDEAKDRVLLGRRDGSNALLPEEKRSVAIHEAGHALVAQLSEHADPVAKITILPAGRALGVTEQLPVDERHLYSESYLLDSLAVRLGGRASENLVVGEASTGAASDLSSATTLGIKMVTEWGLSPRLGVRSATVRTKPPAAIRPPVRPGPTLCRRHPTGHRPGSKSSAHGSRRESACAPERKSRRARRGRRCPPREGDDLGKRPD